MRTFFYALAAIFVGLQYPLWLGQGGVVSFVHIDQQITLQSEHNKTLRERNRALAAEVMDLKGGLGAVEERARFDLGMVRSGESFFHIVDGQ